MSDVRLNEEELSLLRCFLLRVDSSARKHRDAIVVFGLARRRDIDISTELTVVCWERGCGFSYAKGSMYLLFVDAPSFWTRGFSSI